MNFKTISCFLLTVALVVFSTYLSAQIDKGDKYIQQLSYTKAIKAFKKDTKSNDQNKKHNAFCKIANAEAKLNNYQSAETNFKNALLIQSFVNPEDNYNYAQVLKANNNYDEAIKYYQKYIALNPNDNKIKSALKFTKEINYYKSKPIEYETKNLDKINTDKSEFSPFVFKNKLMFVAEKVDFNFVDYTVNDFNGEPFLNMYSSEIKGTELKKSKSFSKKINSEYHDGPACLSADGKTLYFTRVNLSGKKGAIKQAKIFVSTGEGRSWSNTNQFEHNSDDYSMAHPAISSDGKMLVICSNMPGGLGGKDLYICQKTENGWSKPKNLGPDINTSGDEMFPSFRSNGMLYFASNGLPGFGGLDIYSAKNVEGTWLLNRNEGLNLNSNADDFGITFLNDSTGYFSSNRIGGKGKDDIYSFSFQDKSMTLNGTVLLTEDTNNPAKNVKVVLLTDKGLPLDSTKTNNKGFFEFKNLEADKNYMAAIDETDPQFAGKARYYMTDKNGIVQRVTNKVDGKKFVFKNLPIDPNGLPDLYTDDNLTLAGNLLYGENPSKALKNTRLKLINDAGDVLEETKTNEFGAFAFRKIPSDQNYLISIEESDINLPENTKVTLTNKSGKELRTFYTGKDKFKFKILSSDKNLLQEMTVNDEDLVMDVFGYMYDQDRKPISNAKLKIYKEKDLKNPIEVTTAENGKFNFKNLKADENYIFEVDETNPALTNVKRIYIANNKGKIYKIIDKNGEGKFKFKLLDGDKAQLGEFVVDDPWLEVLELKNKQENEKKQLTIIENIYYQSGDYKLDYTGITIMDKVAAVLNSNPKLIIELSSHTDSKASDSFNLALSKKRAQTAVDYLISKGVAKTRLKAVGYGETKLLNKCVNGVECSDEEHKINRRTEFKINEAVVN